MSVCADQENVQKGNRTFQSNHKGRRLHFFQDMMQTVDIASSNDGSKEANNNYWPKEDRRRLPAVHCRLSHFRLAILRQLVTVDSMAITITRLCLPCVQGDSFLECIVVNHVNNILQGFLLPVFLARNLTCGMGVEEITPLSKLVDQRPVAKPVDNSSI